LSVLSTRSRKTQSTEKIKILGAGHPPSKWFKRLNWQGRDKAQSLVWKDLVQSERLRRWTRLGRWVSLYLVGLSVVVIPALPGSDWAVGALALIYWALMIAQQSTLRLRDDLTKWLLFRQLPLSAQQVITGDLIISWVRAVLIAWASLATAALLEFTGLPLLFGANWIEFLGLALLAAFIIGCIGLIGALDMLRQVKSALLLAGQSPQVGMFSLFIGGGIALISALLVSQLAWIGIILALGLSAGTAWIVLLLGALRLQRI
jgi:hypothetical protein